MSARLRIVFAVVTILGFLTPAHAQNTPETAIRQVMDAQVSAWNDGDLVAFMDSYDRSPETTFVGKSVTHGWDAVLQHYREHYTSQAMMGKLVFSELSVRPLDKDVAVATGKFHLTRDAANGGDADGIFSLVFRRGPRGWKIVLDHTS